MQSGLRNPNSIMGIFENFIGRARRQQGGKSNTLRFMVKGNESVKT